MPDVSLQNPAGVLRWRSKGTVALFAVLALCVLLNTQRTAHKPLWFDEFMTLNVVAQPTFVRMIQVAPPEGNPPLQHLLIRLCVDLFGLNAFAMRLPALCGMALAILCIYIFVARRFGQTAAVTSATLFVFSPVCDFGAEARPYGLLLGLTALLLVLWQSAASSEERTGFLAGVAATVFAITITHAFGILWATVPIFCGEAARYWRTRRPDIAMLKAVLFGLCGFGITLFFVIRTHAALFAPTGATHPAISLPSPAKLYEAFRWNGSIHAVALLLPAGIAVWWLNARKRARNIESPVQHKAPLHEWAAVVALILTSVVMYLVSALVTHYFWPRYVLPSALGCFLLLGMTCGAAGRKQITVPVLVCGLSLMLYDRRPTPGKAMPVPRIGDITAFLAGVHPNELLVVESAVQYPQVWWYSPPALRTRLHYITDLQQATRTGDYMGDQVLIAMHDEGSTLFPTDTLAEFLAKNSHFLLWQSRVRNGNWLSDYLRAHDYKCVTVATDDFGDTVLEVSEPLNRR